MVPQAFGIPAGSEWVILAIVALLVFGGARLASVGKNAGRAIREFKEETRALMEGEPLPKDEESEVVADETKRPDAH